MTDDNPWIEEARKACERLGIALDENQLEELADILSEAYDQGVIQAVGAVDLTKNRKQN